jgi:hypothetical protein
VRKKEDVRVEEEESGEVRRVGSEDVEGRARR